MLVSFVSSVVTSISQALIAPVIFAYDVWLLMFYYASPLRRTVHKTISTLSLKSIRRSVKMDIQGRILVYSIVGCPHCMRAKNLLQECDLPYTEISVDLYHETVRADVKARSGKNTVPQIFFNDKYIGGNDDLQALVKDKKAFEELVKYIKENAPPPGAPVVPGEDLLTEDVQGSSFECQPDEYAILVRSLKASDLIADRRSGLKVHKNTFVGKAFVDWIVKTKQLSREAAVEIGQHLIDSHFGRQVKDDVQFRDSSDAYYRLLDDDDSNALNANGISECQPRPAGEVGSDLRKSILKIYSAFLSKDGKKVNYEGIAKSKEFHNYVALTKELQRVQLQDVDREEKVAFFINIYNALVIHANVIRGPPVNTWQRYKFFNTVKYLIGGYEYSLQDIENGILRANRRGIGQISKPFGKNDPRLRVTLEKHEPLVHFALVCGAKSCPPIKTYSANGIYDQLNTAAESFLEGSDGCNIDVGKREIKLSQILKWYREDFGSDNHGMLEWVCDHMGDGAKKSSLHELLLSRNYKLSFMNYDWGINS